MTKMMLIALSMGLFSTSAFAEKDCKDFVMTIGQNIMVAMDAKATFVSLGDKDEKGVYRFTYRFSSYYPACTHTISFTPGYRAKDDTCVMVSAVSDERLRCGGNPL